MHPLKLPELRVHIGYFLATRDILACTAVCHAWYRDFKPLLYRNIRLDEVTLRFLSKETLRQHAHLFRHVVLMEPMHLTLASFALYVDPRKSTAVSFNTHSTQGLLRRYQLSVEPESFCSNLLSLDIHPSLLFRKRVHELVPKYKVLTVGTDQYDMENDDFWCLQSTDACIRLIELNPRLHSLTESWDDMSVYHRIRFANQLCRLQTNLVMMHLSKWEVTPEDLNMLIENSSSLKFLRFSKLIVKRSTGMAVGPREDQDQQHQATGHSSTNHGQQHLKPAATLTATTSTESMFRPSKLDFRQLRVFAVTHASFQLEELQIEAPELLVLDISFSQVNFRRSHPLYPPTAPFPSFSPHHHRHYPQVLWNAPRLEKLICNRTESHVATCTLFEIPRALRIVSFADYEIESRLIANVVAAQGTYLESIRLACFSGISAHDIRLILTNCPNLVNFYAPEIMMWVGDLVPHTADDSTGENGNESDSGDMARKSCKNGWVCHKLERLSIYVCLDSSAVPESTGLQDYPVLFYDSTKTTSAPCGVTSANKAGLAEGAQQQQTYQQPPQLNFQYQHHLQQQSQQCQQDSNQRVFDAFRNQLAKLTRLRHLDLSGEHVEKVDHVQIGLPWTIEGGMEELASLRDLEHVAVTGWIDDMWIQEIEWMKRAWPRLARISLLKTSSPGKTRFQNLLAQAWPELTVQDKGRTNG
ncbi:hypothetical protein BGZ54_009459, partial [Gamsiella multidivaricata]